MKEETSPEKVLFPDSEFWEEYNLSKKNEYQGHLIREVYLIQLPRRWRSSRGDVLLRINNQKIEDVFDYRYMIKG